MAAKGIARGDLNEATSFKLEDPSFARTKTEHRARVLTVLRSVFRQYDRIDCGDLRLNLISREDVGVGFHAQSVTHVLHIARASLGIPRKIQVECLAPLGAASTRLDTHGTCDLCHNITEAARRSRVVRASRADPKTGPRASLHHRDGVGAHTIAVVHAAHVRVTVPTVYAILAA